MRRLHTVAAVAAALAAVPLRAQSAPRDTTAKPAADSVTARAAAPAPGERGGDGESVRPCVYRDADGTCNTRWRPSSGDVADERCVDKDLNGSCDEPEAGRRQGFWSGVGGFFAGLLSDGRKTESEKERDRSDLGVRQRPLGAPRD